MGRPFRIPCVPRQADRSLRIIRHRKPALESLEGRTLLSGTAAALSAVPQALIPNPAAIAVGRMGLTPGHGVSRCPRTAVAD